MAPERRANDSTEFSRRRVLQSMAGVGAGSTAFVTNGAAAGEKPPAPLGNSENIEGESLERLAKTAAKSEDVGNILDDSYISVITNSQPTHTENGMATFGYETEAEITSPLEMDAPSAVSVAAKDELEDGTEMRKISFCLNNGMIVTFGDFEGGNSNRQTQAKLWRVNGETISEATLHLEDVSTNGGMTEIVTPDADVECDGCASAQFKYGTQTCSNADVACIIAGCSGCAYVCRSGSVHMCATCGLVTCGATIYSCCEFSSACSPCAMP